MGDTKDGLGGNIENIRKGLLEIVSKFPFKGRYIEDAKFSINNTFDNTSDKL